MPHKRFKKSVDKYFLHKSKKECIANHSNPVNVNLLNKFSTIDWLNINESQADIHIQAIAELMYDSVKESKPKELKAGDWHIPFGDKMNDDYILQQLAKESEISHLDTAYDIYLYYATKIATARCARISYETLGDNPKVDYEADIRLHDILAESGHWSPFEHCARAMSSEEYNSFFNGFDLHEEVKNFSNDIKGWCRNFKGFIQYRHLIESL